LSNIDKEKNTDQADWEEFLNNPSNISDKDELKNRVKNQSRKYKFDLHGYSIDGANKKIEELINICYEKGVEELLIVTGKGIHTENNDNVYTSKEYNKLQNTLPNFIKNNSDLTSKIYKIELAPKSLGGDGALVIILKKLQNKF